MNNSHSCCSCFQLCLPVLSEEVDDVQRCSVDQPDSQMKGRFPVFLKQKAVIPLRIGDDGVKTQSRKDTISALTCPFASGMGSIRSTPSA